MADVRTFRAATMRDALDLVRDELGADAVILHTRQVAKRRLLPWRKPIEEVEITASLTLEVRSPSERKATKRGPAPATPESERRVAPSTTRTPATRPSVSRPSGTRLDLVSDPPDSIAEVFGRVQTAPQARPAAPHTTPPAALDLPRPARRAFFERSAPPANRLTGRPRVGGSAAVEADESDPTASLARRLDAIQQMLQDLGRSNPAPRHEEIPGELFQLYTELIDGEVEDDVARELICQLKQSANPRQLSDVGTAKSLLTSMVEAEIRCCEPITARPGRRKVVALVGATGVGKTTTIAKLAANFRLRSGIKMGLVTVDTYRVAAVEQLRTYAEIIELPMKVVTNPLEMRRALDELAGLDLVLIDTAGRSPKDDLQIQELKSLLAEAHVDEVHLVMSLTSNPRGLEAAAAKFAAAGTTGMILTKLDEASGMGALLSVARRVKLPISYLTAGQAVPDDIEPAHPRRIARLILGQEKVTK
ncbi:MAG TPA: flagellar biosynthesis protein FlhF [Planctomycetaceae bacterium]|jgi:flagellar biosynthesis protein FlhF|nr:flagellar biosynthesis protein FlhF [Planctomycetaceae bacterium]